MKPYLVQVLYLNNQWYIEYYCKKKKDALLLQQEFEYYMGIPSRVFFNSFAVK